MYPIETIYELFLQHPIISTDSREVSEGAIFFALHGENFDGNRFAMAALDAGAAYAVVDDPLLQGEKLIQVEDVLGVLQGIARMHRRSLSIPIVAITGSNGKTTTKEFTVKVLSTKFRVGSTAGNLNNHIGVPLTLLRFTSQTEIGVVEMGANHQHEIELLCQIAEPDLGLITNLGRAHLEGFGGIEGVIKGKGELLDYLKNSGGVVIYNCKDPVLKEMVASRSGLKSVGYNPDAQPLEMSIYGDYNQLNAQAAYAIGQYFETETESSKSSIREYTPDNNRSQLLRTAYNILYMDAYNANPTSMRVAIDNFSELQVPDKVVILGEMRELGSFSQEEHRLVFEHATVRMKEAGGFNQVFLVGENFYNLLSADCLGSSAFEGKQSTGAIEKKVFKDVEQLTTYLHQNPIRNSHILIKGSRGVALERIIKEL